MSGLNCGLRGSWNRRQMMSLLRLFKEMDKVELKV
jgi:hypothetical protein